MLRRTQKEESAWKSITIFVFGIFKYKMCKYNLEREQNNQLKYLIKFSSKYNLNAEHNLNTKLQN